MLEDACVAPLPAAPPRVSYRLISSRLFFVFYDAPILRLASSMQGAERGVSSQAQLHYSLHTSLYFFYSLASHT